MFRGTVMYASRVPGLCFDQFEVDFQYPGVERIDLELSAGSNLQILIRVANVASTDDGIRAAESAVEKLLNRLAYTLGTGVEDHRFVEATFEPTSGTGSPVTIYPPPGAVAQGHLSVGGGSFVRDLKAALEKPKRAGERYFGLFRSAMKANSDVERFLHLYSLLLLFNNDRQDDVDDFIVAREPSVSKSPSPFKEGKSETIYTRLRNEFAHRRPGVNLDDTKREMGDQWSRLRSFVQEAIRDAPTV